MALAIDKPGKLAPTKILGEMIFGKPAFRSTSHGRIAKQFRVHSSATWYPASVIVEFFYQAQRPGHYQINNFLWRFARQIL